jgi:hypothetical protein
MEKKLNFNIIFTHCFNNIPNIKLTNATNIIYHNSNPFNEEEF